jgi:hypothetical protein
MNEDILWHWIKVIKRGIFVFIAFNEPKIWNVKVVYFALVQYVKEFDKHIKMGGTMRSVGGTQNV